MKSTPTLLISAGIVSALVGEYFTAKTRQRSDIRTECLCWASLALILSTHRCVAHRNRSAFRSPSLTLDLKLWAVSFCIGFSRIIPLHYNVGPSLPLVTIATFILSPLEGPRRRMKCLWVVPLGVCCHFFLLLGFENNYLYLLGIAYMTVRTASFMLLEAYREQGLFPTDNEDLSLNTTEAMVFRVLCISIGVMIAFPSHTDFEWHMIVRTFCSIIEVGATFCLVLLGGTVSATTIDTYSLAAILSFITEAAPQALLYHIAATLSLAQGVLCLPPSASIAGRSLLLTLSVMLVLSILSNQFRPSRAVWSQRNNMSAKGGLDPSMHPIEYLAADAEAKFYYMVNRQSQTLDDACTEYERRYGRQPPPNFDLWFQAAQKSGFVLVDEFDTMMAAIEPLWGVAPVDIRSRVENAIKTGHRSMIRFEITDHKISSSMENWAHWMAPQILGWFNQGILDTLPDLVFAVNVMDEPKVVVAHDALEKALANGRAFNNKATPDAHVNHPGLCHQVDFLEVGEQHAWEAMIISCPIDSPARGFYSQAALLSWDFPGLRNLHAALLTPASLGLTHSMVPVFSQGKFSCFQDLLYPSPGYAERLDMLEYHEEDDMDWENKTNSLYWAGSNTGGHSTMENWRFFQRQRLALMVGDNNQPVTFMRKIFPAHQESNHARWETVNSTLAEISPVLDIRISAIIQCEKDACEDQEATLNPKSKPRDAVSASYAARYNLDLDGNGFSGRFYRLLGSKSAVLKQTLYQEWHDDWLVPWVHYIPLRMDLKDFPEVARYLTQEPEGQALGKKVAEQSQKWANTVLRKEDMVLVFWRLMLEYARVLDDNREHKQCCLHDK